MTAPAPTAVVLAGGAGTRLRAAVPDRPKPLAEVGGRPFLSYLLDQIAAAGIRRAILCTGHLAELVEDAFGGRYREIEIVHSREMRPLGTGGALRAALPCLAGDDLLVLNGDSYCHVSLAGFVAWARAGAAPAALVAVEVPDTARFGTVRLAGEDRVASFVEKGGGGGPGLINAGIYWFRRDLLPALPARVPLSLETEVLPLLAATGLGAWRTAAPFLDIGTPDSYREAPGFLARGAASPRAGLLVLDRDGTLIAERHYLADPAGVELLPGAIAGLRAFLARGYEIALVTNQSGIGRGYFDEAALDAVHEELLAQLARAGIPVKGIWHCPHRPDEGCSCRKPAPGLLEAALRELGYTPAQCLVVGDKRCDIDLGRRVGARTALVRTGYGAATEEDGGCSPDRVADSLADLALQEVGE